MPTPPDLTEPFKSQAEREQTLAWFQVLWLGLEALIYLGRLPASYWTSSQVKLFPARVPDGPSEHPSQRLARWGLVYAQEIDAVRSIRNQAVHGLPLGDQE